MPPAETALGSPPDSQAAIALSVDCETPYVSGDFTALLAAVAADACLRASALWEAFRSRLTASTIRFMTSTWVPPAFPGAGSVEAPAVCVAPTASAPTAARVISLLLVANTSEPPPFGAPARPRLRRLERAAFVARPASAGRRCVVSRAGKPLP